ncbi:MAG: hypothetical protein AB1439_00530 [candidate division FCPU426 bacterium]
MSLISPELIEMFNQAAKLAREEHYEESLALWEQILDPKKRPGHQASDERMVVTGDFLGQSMLRKAWVLMDLERYPEAREVFASDLMEACLGQFELDILYEYFFSFGNTLGSLGDIEGMDDKLSRAMSIAAEELGDYQKLRQCWLNLLDHAARNRDWKYILRESDVCLKLAQNYKDEELAETAENAREQARNGLKGR